MTVHNFHTRWVFVVYMYMITAQEVAAREIGEKDAKAGGRPCPGPV